MALRAKVLQVKAEKFEAKQLLLHKVTKERVSSLEPLLEDVYVSRRPKPSDYEARRQLIRVFNEIAKEIYGNAKETPVVVEFGSFVMDLFSTTSDLDLSVNFSTNSVSLLREKKIQTLRKFAKKLYALQHQGHVYGVLPITTAKVPIVKVFDRGTGVECDISVENRDGILKSKIIHIISSIDERFPKLCFLMKNWAKANKINSSKDRTLNSLSIILMVAFHLQTRKPPILPPFSAIFKDGIDPATVEKSLPNFVNYGKSNEESLAELFFTLLIKLSSVEKLWPKGLCVSTCDASWISKTWESKVACISVEDFTDRSQNVARAVGPGEAKQISKCINVTLSYLFSFLDGKIEVGKLKDLLFGRDGGVPNAPNLLGITVARLTSNPSQSRAIVGKKRKKNRQLEYVRNPSWVEDQLLTTAFDVRNAGQKYMGGWDGDVAGGWGGAHPPGAGNWGGAQQTIAGNWGGNQQTFAGNWDGNQQHIAGNWSENQQAISGGWGGAHQPDSRNWGGNQQHGNWGGASDNPAWIMDPNYRSF